jgi:hypothetical protein
MSSKSKSSKSKSSKKESYDWAIVSVEDSKVLREAPTGRRAIYTTRSAAREALKSKTLTKGGSMPKLATKAIEARVVKRTPQQKTAGNVMNVSTPASLNSKQYATPVNLMPGTTSLLAL